MGAGLANTTKVVLRSLICSYTFVSAKCMCMKKMAAGILLLIAHGQQIAAQTVSYRVEDHVHSMAPLKAGACLSFASGNQISAGGIIQGSPLPALFCHMEYRAGLVRGFSNRGFTGKDELLTTQPETKGRYMEAGAGWAIMDMVGKGKLRITTATGIAGERFFYAQCAMRKVVTVDAGVLSLRYAYYLGSDSGSCFESGGIKLTPGADKAMHTNIQVGSVYAGLSYRKIKKAAVISGGYRYRNFKSVTWSGQILAGNASAGDVTVAGTVWPVTKTHTSALGYRILFRADRGPTSTCVELGKMPHLVFDNNANAPDLSLFGTQGISSFLNYFRLGFNFILVGSDRRYGLRQRA